MTVDSLCNAIRVFLLHVANNPHELVDKDNGLRLWDVPKDETMKTVMDAFGGTLRITITEIPQQLQPEGGISTTKAEVDNHVNIWHP